MGSAEEDMDDAVVLARLRVVRRVDTGVDIIDNHLEPAREFLERENLYRPEPQVVLACCGDSGIPRAVHHLPMS